MRFLLPVRGIFHIKVTNAVTSPDTVKNARGFLHQKSATLNMIAFVVTSLALVKNVTRAQVIRNAMKDQAAKFVLKDLLVKCVAPILKASKLVKLSVEDNLVKPLVGESLVVRLVEIESAVT
jgi:hypothetical protein